MSDVVSGHSERGDCLPRNPHCWRVRIIPPWPCGQVRWVADEAGLAAAMAAAVEADAVGLDVEWRPGRERCPQPPASLLQVARLLWCGFP